MKKVAEKVKMGLDDLKSFAQVYEDRYMNKRIRGKMMKLDPIIIQEPRKEIRTRKTQSSFKIRCESNNFIHIFIRTVVAQGRTPLNHRFQRKETLTNKGFQVRF